MTPTDLQVSAEAFRSAIEERDFPRADGALRKYAAWFRSHPATVEEIESARQLLQWGVSVTRSHQGRIAEELKLLEEVFKAYRPGRRLNTWRLEG